MMLENPFFTRELRALGRRHFAYLAQAILWQAAFLGAAFLSLENRLPWNMPDEGFRRILGLLLLVGTQEIACGFVGWRMGEQIFQEEHRQGTLECLRMLPISP